MNGERWVHPDDRSSDQAYNGTMMPPKSVRRSLGPRPWARQDVPRDPFECRAWLKAIEDGHLPGEVFYHPGRGSNVVKTPGGDLAVVEHGPLDEADWLASGCDGPALPLMPKPEPKPAAPPTPSPAPPPKPPKQKD